MRVDLRFCKVSRSFLSPVYLSGRQITRPYSFCGYVTEMAVSVRAGHAVGVILAVYFPTIKLRLDGMKAYLLPNQTPEPTRLATAGSRLSVRVNPATVPAWLSFGRRLRNYESDTSIESVGQIPSGCRCRIRGFGCYRDYLCYHRCYDSHDFRFVSDFVSRVRGLHQSSCRACWRFCRVALFGVC